MAEFKDRLKFLRDEMGLTQMELAKIIKTTYSTVSDYERGSNTDPRCSTLRRISDYFNVKIDYLVGDTDIREPKRAEKFTDVISNLTDEQKKELAKYALYLRGDKNQ